MNYYIQGGAAKADKIKAAFEKLGYDVKNWRFTTGVYYSLNGRIVNTSIGSNEYKLILNNPDYKELELHIEPKFKVGDWIVATGKCVYLITKIDEFTVILVDVMGDEYEFGADLLNDATLWTINDAKDGDVITNGKMIVIFNKLEEPTYKQHIIAYVGLDLCGRLQITEDIWQLGVDKAMPATKEQSDLLFKKIKEAGYQWDSDNKELHKIQPHYDIANFRPFDKVLVRQNDSSTWGVSFFGRFDGMFMCCTNVWFQQCIPYEGNEHLLGTTDMCSEEYINW